MRVAFPDDFEVYQRNDAAYRVEPIAKAHETNHIPLPHLFVADKGFLVSDTNGSARACAGLGTCSRLIHPQGVLDQRLGQFLGIIESRSPEG